MSLSERQADTLIGALVVGVALVLGTAIYFTLGWNQRRWDLFVTAASAQDISSDTKVFLQGLEVGRVEAINPRISPQGGGLSFLVHLRINVRFQDGSPVRLPTGTSADISAASAFGGGTLISLHTPAVSASTLEPGDTIPSARHSTPLDQIAQVADSLAHQVSLVLADTRRLLGDVDGTVREVHRTLAATGPGLQRAVAQVDASLTDLRPLLHHADSLVRHTDQRFSTIQDSLVQTLTTARRLTEHLDSLVQMARTVGSDNRDDIRTTVENLRRTSAALEYFIDQVSRRPLRLIGGIHPPPPDSAQRPPADSGGGR